MKKRIGKRSIVIIIDEFPYLFKSDRSIISQFQRIVDDFLPETQIHLILVGSSLGMMESHVLSYQSPLYGRRSIQIKLQPLEFKDARQFFPQYNIEEAIVVILFLGECLHIYNYLTQTMK